ncbi:MAG: serine acetyltransferase [Gammaproteobacteria bacterium]|nr:serine acetyltransferase [Gammaproteobacteria bacterium]
MRDAYNRYMHKVFDHEFIDYPGELLGSSYALFALIEDVLILDIRAKYKDFDNCLDSGLFQLLLLDPTIEAIFYYRLSRAHYLSDENHPLLPFLSALMRRRTGMELYYSTSIGVGLSIIHGTGIVIGPRYDIGDNFLIYQGVTIGQSIQDGSKQKVRIGNNVIVYAGAKILGDVQIGDNVQVGANAVVVNDLKSNAVYAGVPARLIRELV